MATNVNIRRQNGGGLEGVSVEEMEDQMKCIAWEIEMEKNKASTTVASKEKKKKNHKEPTREHLLLRDCSEEAIKWERALRAKHTQGQAAEIVARILENVDKPEFPSEPYHNWTEELMEEAKIGWCKFKAMEEMLEKYPQQNMEQMYCEEKDEWTMVG